MLLMLLLQAGLLPNPLQLLQWRRLQARRPSGMALLLLPVSLQRLLEYVLATGDANPTATTRSQPPAGQHAPAKQVLYDP
jgi:hypothetical protein